MSFSIIASQRGTSVREPKQLVETMSVEGIVLEGGLLTIDVVVLVLYRAVMEVSFMYALSYFTIAVTIEGPKII